MLEPVFLGVLGLGAALALLSFARIVDPAWLVAGGLCASVFSGNWYLIGLPGSVDRVLIATGAVFALLRARRSQGGEGVRLHLVHIVLATLLAEAAISAVWTHTISDHAALFALFDKYGAVPFTLFFVAPVAFRTTRQREILLTCLLVLGAYLGVVAILEGLKATSLILPRFIANPNVGISYGRARGPFLASDADGQALFVCAVSAALAIWIWWGREERRGGRIAAWLVLAACLLGLIFTLTRSVWLAGGIALLVTLVAAPPLRPLALPAIAATVLLIVVVFVGVPGFQGRANERVNDNSPVWDRKNSNTAALRMIEARPLLGFGWYRFKDDGLRYFGLARDYPQTVTLRVHNVFLSNAAELGLPVTAIWGLVLLFVLARGVLARGSPELDPWRAGLLAIGVFWLIIANFTPLGYAFSNFSLWFWAGLLALNWLDRPLVLRRRVAEPSRGRVPVTV